MILREIRRFLRRGFFTTVVASIVLTAGFAGSAITLNLIRALNSPWKAGLQTQSFATIAQQTPAGGLARISWDTVEHLQNSLRLPGAVMAAYAPPSSYQLQWQEHSIQVSVAFTQAEFFSKFTHPLYAGRNFTPGRESRSEGGEAIVSEDFSKRFFGSTDSALNQEIRIAGQRFTVIGVAPKAFEGLWRPTDIWTTPPQWGRLASAGFNQGGLSPVSWRLAQRWYLLVAAAPEMRPVPAQAVAAQLRGEYNRTLHLQAVEGLTDDPVGERNVQASSRLGFMVAAALLLAASLNYCILLFARSSRSVEEFRLKLVLGAKMLRLALDAAIGPLFVVFVSFLLSGAATVLIQHYLKVNEKNPVIAAGLGTGSAVKMLVVEFPLACLLGALITVVPVFSLVRKSGAPRTGFTTTQTKRERLLLNSIVVIEITVCTLVCLFAGAFVRQYYLLSKVDIGFDARNLTSFEVGMITKGGGTIVVQTSSAGDSPIEAFVRLSMLEAQEQFPAMQSITAASCTPFGPPMKTIDIYRFQQGSEPLKAVSFCTVTQNFFSTLGMSLYQGAGFQRADYKGDISHVVINQSLAKALWPGQNAVNKTIHLEIPGSNLGFDVSVVGVASDSRQAGALSSPQSTVYLPLTGNAFAMSFPVYFLTRGSLSPEKFADIVQRQSQSTVKQLGIMRSYPVEEKIQASWREQNLRLKLAVFGALLVASIAYLGLYGVLIHSVLAQQKEIALRLAFGASGWAIQRVVVENALLCCFTAICIALFLWKACLGFLDPRWMGGASWSWTASGITSLLCAMVSIGTSIVPAGKATRISPVTVLKDE